MNKHLGGVEKLLDNAILLMQKGQFLDAITEAENLLSQNVPPHTLGSCYWIIGCAKRDLGNLEIGLAHLIEATAIFAEENQILLLAHAQDELARTLFQLKKINAAIFFIRMAISNFEALENLEMSNSCSEFLNSLT
jgi:tetratricopeptide (TPR) repeat protein